MHAICRLTLAFALALALCAVAYAADATDTTVPPPPPRITIDAAKTGEPLSKYVYGQFIEHLGRCIYGGIWAEMLEDRKFFYDITPKYEPYGAAPKEVP
ncbi:MAG: hypothetical protein NT049_02945, partial [Planctomycetota bacterium]|nr:hypothetical protein [Planctomycetota bacterium]